MEVVSIWGWFEIKFILLLYNFLCCGNVWGLFCEKKRWYVRLFKRWFCGENWKPARSYSRNSETSGYVSARNDRNSVFTYVCEMSLNKIDDTSDVVIFSCLPKTVSTSAKRCNWQKSIINALGKRAIYTSILEYRKIQKCPLRAFWISRVNRNYIRVEIWRV